MVIKCPRCHSEFDLELDDVVVEMLFSCPNCKARFIVKNSDGDNVSLIEEETREAESRFQPVEETPVPTPKPDTPAPQPTTVTEVQEEKKPAPVQEPSTPIPPKPTQQPTPARPAKGRRKPAWMAVVLALLVVGGGLAAWLLSQDMGATTSPADVPVVEKEHASVCLALDISTSMLAEDLQPNRFEAFKTVAPDLLEPLSDDSIGLVVFAGQVLTQCTLTDRHDSLLHLLHDVDVEWAARGDIEDGTALGMGLACAVAQLRPSSARHKAVVLFTDGSNNRGEVSPLTAAELARMFRVRVFTVAVGAKDTARYPLKMGGKKQYINIPVEIDAETLKAIATATGGKFYRADSQDSLRSICQDIARQVGARQESAPGAPSTEYQMDEKTASRMLNMVLRQEKKTKRPVGKL